MSNPFQFMRVISVSFVLASCAVPLLGAPAPIPTDASPLRVKAAYFQQDLLDKHWLDGLYVSIVPSAPAGTKLEHTVNQPGNVIHSGVWTGRYLAGVGYQYAATKDPWVRKHGGEILRALRIQQEVTGKAGLLARGYVKGHGPVEDWERNGADSKEWHQGQGKYADYRWYGDVSVDNFNAVLYGYAIYFDLAADADQKKFIAYDVNRLMTHLLDNHCRIMDVDDEPTQWGHVGIDPDPARDDYYKNQYSRYRSRAAAPDAPWKPSLRASLMLLPDLLIADHITHNPRYREFYQKVVDRFKDNPDIQRESGGFTLQRLARVNHSSEGQAYEALYNLVRYEKDPALLAKYRPWVSDLWEMNWMEGNSLFAFMTLALLPEYRAPLKPGVSSASPAQLSHGEDGLRLARETLRDFPVNRVLSPVMNSLRTDIERNPAADRAGNGQSAKPIPVNQRPLDNEYTWKGNPYQLDGWLKSSVTMFQFSCDDPKVAWFCDTSGKLFRTLDGGLRWEEMNNGMMGASVQNILASTNRTFVLYAKTDRGVMISRDGALSWRPAPSPSGTGQGEGITSPLPSASMADRGRGAGGEGLPEFKTIAFSEWQKASATVAVRIGADGKLMRTTDAGKTESVAMNGWRIPRANSVFLTPWGIVASGPGGCYRSQDAVQWTELKLWREQETGAADFLHAYWLGRDYGFIGKNE